MKKSVSLLLSIIMTLSLFVGTVTFGSVGASAVYMVGDVDGDGKIGNNDYLELKTSIQANSAFSGTNLIFSDLNGDGVVTSADAMMMVGYINGTVLSLAKGIEPGYLPEYNYVTIVKDSNLTYNAGHDSTGGTATVTDSGVGVTLVADSDTTDEYWELSLGGEVIDANKKYTVIFKLQNSVSNVGVGCVKDELIKDDSGNDHHGINTFYGNYTYDSSSKAKTLRYRRGLYEISDTRDGGTRKSFPYSTSYVDDGYVTLKLTAEYNGTTFISTLYALNTSYEWKKVTSEPVGFSSGNTFGLYFLFGSDAGSTIKLKDVAYNVEDLGTSVTPAYPTISILDYNVWTNHSGSFGTSTPDWIKSQYSPDLMGFQEVDSGWYTALKNAFKANYGYTGEFRTSSGGEAGPVFYKKSTFTLLKDGTYWLTNTPNTVSKISSSEYYRIMTFTVLYHKASGNIIKYTNTHLDNTSSSARQQQASYLNTYINELPSYVSIVTGDFNEQPSGTVFSKMTNTYGYSSLAKIAATTDGQNQKTYEDGQIYDYIFIKDKARIKALLYDVRTSLEANSDHYPLYGEFQLIN